jgi:hypothetical protein
MRDRETETERDRHTDRQTGRESNKSFPRMLYPKFYSIDHENVNILSWNYITS